MGKKKSKSKSPVVLKSYEEKQEELRREYLTTEQREYETKRDRPTLQESLKELGVEERKKKVEKFLSKPLFATGKGVRKTRIGRGLKVSAASGIRGFGF